MLLALDASELNELFKNRKVGTSVFADCGLGASKFRLGYGGKQELYLHTVPLNQPAYSMNSQLERQTRPVFAKVHKEASEFWEREAATASAGLVLGFACSCRFYLMENQSRVWCQRRGDQDPCEHHFAHVRAAGGSSGNVTAYRASHATAWAGDMRLQAGGASNCADAPITTQEAASELAQSKRRR